MYLNAPRGLSECVTDGQQSSDGPAEMSDSSKHDGDARQSFFFFFFFFME